MGVGQSKEGFSLFGMLNHCVSPMGKRLLKLWFSRPIVNLAVLQDRQVWSSLAFADITYLFQMSYINTIPAGATHTPVMKRNAFNHVK